MALRTVSFWFLLRDWLDGANAVRARHIHCNRGPVGVRPVRWRLVPIAERRDCVQRLHWRQLLPFWGVCRAAMP